MANDADYISALSVYGGFDEVFSRVTKDMIKGLEGKTRGNQEEIDELERFLNLEEGTLNKLKCGKRTIGKKEYHSFQRLFDICLGDYLQGDEILQSEDARNYWEAEEKKNPLRYAIPTGMTAEEAKSILDLKSYVQIMAIGEFYEKLDSSEGTHITHT